MVKNLPANRGDEGDVGCIPGVGRSPGVGNGNPPQYSCLENTMDRGVWQAAVHGVAKGQIPLSTHTGTVLLEALWENLFHAALPAAGDCGQSLAILG